VTIRPLGTIHHILEIQSLILEIESLFREIVGKEYHKTIVISELVAKIFIEAQAVQ